MIPTGVLPALALLGVLGLWMLGAHNRVIALRAAVLSAWAPVEAAMAQRAQAIATLLAQAEQPLHTERAAMDAVAAAQAQVDERTEAVRRRPAQRDAVAELSKADAVLAATLPRLLALIEQQHALVASPEVQQALAALAEARPRLGLCAPGLQRRRRGVQCRRGSISHTAAGAGVWLWAGRHAVNDTAARCAPLPAHC